MSKNFDIFISYRRKETADKAEHLFSLLEMEGYKGRVSFDRENFDGFDLKILQRLDDYMMPKRQLKAKVIKKENIGLRSYCWMD